MKYSRQMYIAFLLFLLSIIIVLPYFLMRNTNHEKTYHTQDVDVKRLAVSSISIEDIQLPPVQEKHKGKIDDGIVKLAIMNELKYSIPAELTIAQFIHESRWGKSKLYKEGNNPFGHKHWTNSAEGTAGIIKEYDDCNGEKCDFQAYDTRWHAFHYHATRILPKYAKVRKGDSIEEWVECLCSKENKIGDYNYATDCKGGKYEKFLLNIIKSNDLKKYSLKNLTGTKD